MGIFSALKKAIFGESVDYSAILEDGGLLIDVRTPVEFKSGHAKKSKNIPLSNLPNNIQQLKGKKVVLVCKSGIRAAQAKNMLRKQGIEAYNAGSWHSVN